MRGVLKTSTRQRQWQVGEFKIETRPANMAAAKENDRSTAIIIDHKGQRVLLTGDLERSGESFLSKYKGGPSY